MLMLLYGLFIYFIYFVSSAVFLVRTITWERLHRSLWNFRWTSEVLWYIPLLFLGSIQYPRWPPAAILCLFGRVSGESVSGLLTWERRDRLPWNFKEMSEALSYIPLLFLSDIRYPRWPPVSHFGKKMGHFFSVQNLFRVILKQKKKKLSLKN